MNKIINKNIVKVGGWILHKAYYSILHRVCEQTRFIKSVTMEIQMTLFI